MISQINTYQKLSVFVSVLLKYYSQEKNITNISGNHRNLHQNFFNLKQKFPDHLMRMRFNENGHYPISDELDSIFQDFQMSGKINKLNPGFKEIQLNPSETDESVITRKLPWITLAEVKTIANELSL